METSSQSQHWPGSKVDLNFTPKSSSAEISNFLRSAIYEDLRSFIDVEQEQLGRLLERPTMFKSSTAIVEPTLTSWEKSLVLRGMLLQLRAFIGFPLILQRKLEERMNNNEVGEIIMEAVNVQTL